MSSPELSPEIQPDSPDTPAADRFSTKRFRTLELLLVLGVAFFGPVLLSLMVISGVLKYQLDGDKARIAMGIANEIIALLVLAYVLNRQGKSFHVVLERFRWQDLPWSILLSLVGYVASILIFYAINLAFLATGTKLVVPTVSMKLGLSVVSIFFIALNPLFEEVLVRSYLMSEVLALTGKGLIAVVCSVALQVVYHLYQGAIPAIMYSGIFLVYSLYYLKTKRIWPVVLAHFYMDALALLHYR